MKPRNIARVTTTMSTSARWSAVVGSVALTALALASGSIRATVDGEEVFFDGAQPSFMNSRLMVPVRGIFEHFNASVQWDYATQSVVADRGTDHITLPLNSEYATVNGKQMTMDAPARMSNGRVMVPLRFLSESLGASVEWVSSSQTVEIKTMMKEASWTGAGLTGTFRTLKGTVIPFKLRNSLNSAKVSKGDRFSAMLDSEEGRGYEGIPTGTILEGHVSLARPKKGQNPGVLGLAFDRVRTPGGSAFPIRGALIGLDPKSVEMKDGRLVARPGSTSNNLKYAGYGAGAGAIVAIAGKGNLLKTSLIGGVLGMLVGSLEKRSLGVRDVTVNSGSKIGVRLTQDLVIRTNRYPTTLR